MKKKDVLHICPHHNFILVSHGHSHSRLLCFRLVLKCFSLKMVSTGLYCLLASDTRIIRTKYLFQSSTLKRFPLDFLTVVPKRDCKELL